MPSQYYEQGRHDAETGEFNQLFYHTYLDYKRGYDEVQAGSVRRRNRMWIWLPLVLGIGLGGGWVLRDQGILAQPEPPVVLIVTPTPIVPTPTFPFITATPAPPTPTGITVSGLGIGVVAQVTTDGGVLRVRPQPSTNGEPVGSLKNETSVTLVGGPQEGDGYTWWEIEADGIRGWVAADFLKLKP